MSVSKHISEHIALGIKSTGNLATLNWYEQANNANFTLNAVCFGFKYVAVGAASGASPYIQVSKNGKSWTTRTAAKNLALNAVAYSFRTTSPYFIAVGAADTDSYIVRSSDGISWTEIAPAVAKAVALNSVAYSKPLDVWVAVGDLDAGQEYILSSTNNGTTWTQRTGTAWAQPFYSVWWSDYYSKFFAVGGTYGSGVTISQSVDGTTWTDPVGIPAGTARANCIIANGRDLLIVGGETGGVPTGNTWISTDGASSWTPNATLPSSLQNYELKSACYGMGYYVAVGIVGATDGTMARSLDGINWEVINNNKKFNLNGIALATGETGFEGGTGFVVVGAADGTDAYLLQSMLAPV